MIPVNILDIFIYTPISVYVYMVNLKTIQMKFTYIKIKLHNKKIIINKLLSLHPCCEKKE